MDIRNVGTARLEGIHITRLLLAPRGGITKSWSDIVDGKLFLSGSLHG